LGHFSPTLFHNFLALSWGVLILTLYRQDNKQIKGKRRGAARGRIWIKGCTSKKTGTVTLEDRPHEIVQRELD
jgi:hypothetical protein